MNADTKQLALETIATTADLNTAIKRLERKRILIEEDVKDHFHNLLENLRPANILKNTLLEVQESVSLKHNLLNLALGLGAGYLSRKLVVGKSAGLVKKALGAALQFGITHFIASKDNGTDEKNYNTHREKKNLLKRVLSI
jgi:hypothetical protein